MKNFWLFAGFLGLYFALQLWILPAFGVATWLSGACSPGENKDQDKVEKKEAEPVKVLPVKGEDLDSEAPKAGT